MEIEVEKSFQVSYNEFMQKPHNIMEDIVQAKIDEVCGEITKKKPDEAVCTCEQCKLDAACYVLNRVKPQYLLSSRGLVREDHRTLDKLQRQVDVQSLVLQALKIVGHHRRTGVGHEDKSGEKAEEVEKTVFNIPIIVGRLFNGQNFEPMCDIEVELFHDGKLIPMKNINWQNPCFISPQMIGTYTFWTHGIAAEKAGERKIFDLLIRVEAPGFETLTHHFEVPVISEDRSLESFSVERNFKVIDLYMFPPEIGEEK
jgi:competence protein ComFB